MNHQSASLWPLLLFFSLLTVMSGLLHAVPSSAQWHALNNSIVTVHIVPGYQRFAAASRALETASQQLCKQPDMQQLQRVQQAFQDTMDGWQKIQHLQFGPIENLMRNFSIQFWPDKKNLTSKQLNHLLAEQNPDTLQPDYFRSASIAVKGLPAMERLIFNGKGVEPFRNNSYHCRLNAGISSYLATMGRETADEWRNFSNAFVTPGDGISYYDDNQEAAIDLMKSLVEPVEVIRDLKILRPLGNKAGRVKPRRTESWRSQHSLRNIQLNISSLHSLYSGTGNTSVRQLLEQQGGQTLANDIDIQFDTIEQQLGQVPAPISASLKQPQTQQQFRQLAAELKILHQQLSTVTQLLNIQLGFNSRDGD
ncbi:MAG: imelysin family protein [Amphritea sp.]